MKLSCRHIVLAGAMVFMRMAQGEQSQAAFISAVRNQSTSPAFVQVQVEGPGSGRSMNCVTANLLLGAIHLEHHLTYSPEDTASAERIAISSPNHAFHFSSAAAFSNVPEPPTAADFEAADRLVAKEDPATLDKSLEGGGLYRFYFNAPRRQQHLAALACALIDRGYAPNQADINGALYVGK